MYTPTHPLFIQWLAEKRAPWTRDANARKRVLIHGVIAEGKRNAAFKQATQAQS